MAVLLLLLIIVSGVGSVILWTSKNPKAEEIKLILKTIFQNLKELFGNLKKLFSALKDLIDDISSSESQEETPKTETPKTETPKTETPTTIDQTTKAAPSLQTSSVDQIVDSPTETAVTEVCEMKPNPTSTSQVNSATEVDATTGDSEKKPYEVDPFNDN
ncbi:hypothetical protein [Prochlorococcus sp. MIT 1341]|uniref:hypothetical protein n=1 Tax=Prochlorococcus sp. MIT 1341 TaxID=3096221 RepID=UPI002A74BF28|nr:hypothetical protein [Prochlorococcus sp. MIT 1341]